MREATHQSLNLSQSENKNITNANETPAQLRARLVEAYERMCGGMGSDEARKNSLLNKFNKSNEDRRSLGKQDASVEEFIKSTYPERVEKKRAAKIKLEAASETHQKAPSKKSSLH